VCFELLHSRLLDYLRGRVKSGELTERKLARMAGVSQPHMHNVLKGTRVLSTPKADVVMLNLRLNVLDLLGEEELGGTPHSPSVAPQREVPLARDPLGPDYRFPDFSRISCLLTLSPEELEGIGHPVAVRLADDPHVPPVFRAGDVVLLDLLPAGRQTFAAGGYYAIEVEGRGLLRCHQPDPQPAGGVVRAKAVWIGRSLRPCAHRASPV